MSAARSRQRDNCGIQEEGIPSLVLMERAALGLCDVLEACAGKDTSFWIACGPGNNGADGLAMARILQERGHEVSCYAPRVSGEGILQKSICEKRDVPFKDEPEDACWIVDALFGSGLSRPIQGDYAKVIESINDSGKRVFAVDMPSGIHGTTGPTDGAVVKADVTACIDCLKMGAFMPASLPLTGELHCIPIGLLPETEADTYLITRELVHDLLSPRSRFSYKGTYGKVIMAGGSSTMAGAISMALDACFHAGCGLLSAAVPVCLADMVRLRHPEAMLVSLEEKDGQVTSQSAHKITDGAYTLISCGNGLGRGAEIPGFVRSILASDKPVVLDADGISVCDINWLNRAATTILTPHVGEFARLTKKSVSDILADPISRAREFSLQYPNTVLVLKNDAVYVAAKGVVYVLCRPDSRLAKGGSGDVLCGIITGLAAYNDPLTAAIAGVWAHNTSALLSDKDPRYFTPADLVKGLDKTWKLLSQ